MSAGLALVLAAPSGEAAKSGPWGLAIILLLCAACYFLFKSMSRHLRKVRDGFPADAAKPKATGMSGTGPSLTKTAEPGNQAPASGHSAASGRAGPDETSQPHETSQPDEPDESA